jgi:small subunit ribosomal protein S1
VKILEIDSERRRLSLSIKRVEDQILPRREVVATEGESDAGDLDNMPDLGLSEDVFAAAPVVEAEPEAEVEATEPEAEVEAAEPEAEVEAPVEPEADVEAPAEVEPEAQAPVEEPEPESEPAAAEEPGEEQA